jgi:hypothetical protein
LHCVAVVLQSVIASLFNPLQRKFLKTNAFDPPGRGSVVVVYVAAPQGGWREMLVVFLTLYTYTFALIP